MMKTDRNPNESLFDYKARLFMNRKDYGLEWDDVAFLINKHQPMKMSGDHIRKKSYGYLEAIQDQTEKKYDKNILVINDLHLPYERDDVLEIIKKHNYEIDMLVIGGDLMDCQSISTFDNLNPLKLSEELVYTHTFLTKVRKILGDKEIFMIRGNHEERMHRDISKMQKKQLQPLINPEVLEMFIDGFTLYEDGVKTRYRPIENLTYVPKWYAQIDRMIVCHPKDFSRVKGKICENVATYFNNQSLDYDLIVTAHTHKFAFVKVERNNNKLVLENSCLCLNMEYADIGKLGYSPQTAGYAIVRYNMDEQIKADGVEIKLLTD